MKATTPKTIALSPELYERTMDALADWIDRTENSLESLIPSKNASAVVREALKQECHHLAELVSLVDELRALAPSPSSARSSRKEAA